MEDRKDKIVDLLINKAAVKQDVADYSEGVFNTFKEAALELVDELRKDVDDTRVRLRIEDKSSHEFNIYVGSDVLVFQLHRNIFRLPDDNPLWKTKYLQENGANGYFGIINIYDFLAESFEQNRLNDPGYLIGRMFMNHNENYMVEGKGQLGFLYRDLENSVIKKEDIRNIIESSMIYAIEFDLLTPPYEMVQAVPLAEIQAISSNLQMATGKRLGFKFAVEDENIF